MCHTHSVQNFQGWYALPAWSMPIELSRRDLAITAVAALGIYILLPTIFPSKNPRLSKYTRGLVNSGNDCFANSTFQALSSLNCLKEWLGESIQEYHTKHGIQSTSEEDKEPTNVIWIESLMQFLDQLTPENLSSSDPISVWPLLRVMEARYGARISRAQQDAHEMLVRALEMLETEAKVNHLDTLTAMPFSGKTCDEIRCLYCQYTKAVETEFLVLERQPDEEVLGKQSELISDYRCDNCHQLVTIEKSNSIAVLPKLLIVHINRSQSYSGTSFRNNSATAILPKLPSQHVLKAVVFHKGSHYRGHYTCARQQRTRTKTTTTTLQHNSPQNDSPQRKSQPSNPQPKRARKWWMISDDSVREVNLNAVTSRTSDAYMLFYERE